jgi:hypothetical protein
MGIIWLWNPSTAYASEYTCLTLVNRGNRIASSYAGSWSSGSSFYNNRPTTLAIVRDYCYDAGGQYGYSYGYSWAQNSNIIATRVVSVPDNNDWTDYIQSWDMSQVADRLGCAANRGKVGFPGINQVVAMLPQSPTNMRIPTLISTMAGQNS